MNKVLSSLAWVSVLGSLVSGQTAIGLHAPRADAGPYLVQTPSRNVEAARPLLGYIADSSNIVHAVVGSATSAQWGDPLVLPDPTAIAFLPPREEYVLLSSDSGLSVARLSRSSALPGALIPNALAHPERVVFSPSGEALVLLSRNRIQVLSQLSTEPQVRWSIPISNPGETEELALSDDGEVLVARSSIQPAVYSLQGAPWRQLATSYWPDAWTFLPHSHDLILSDRHQQAIAVLPQVERGLPAERVLASGGIDANLMSSNRQGTALVAVESGTSNFWTISLTTGAVIPQPVKGGIDSLTVLRDGQSFLVSTKASPLVIPVSADPVQSVVAIDSH